MAGPQYTKCVSATDYRGPDVTPEILAGLAALGAAPFTAGASLLAIPGLLLTGLREVADYMLNRKLVCLGSTVTDLAQRRLTASPASGSSCAIGSVANFEPVGSKSFPDSIDNDFSINMILYPFNHYDFKDRSPEENLQLAREGYQGVFLSELGTLPIPEEPVTDGSRYGGYYSPFFYQKDTDTFITATEQLITEHKLKRFFGTPLPWVLYEAPVLHAECEGSRINDVLRVLDDLPLGSKGCRDNPLFWLLCVIRNIILSPVAFILLLDAWHRAHDGDYRDALGNGVLRIDDRILVRGRWVWDGGHSGYNEIHAVHTIQKIEEPYPDPKDFENFYIRWCKLSSETPELGVEDDWETHPDIDGCTRLLVHGVKPEALPPRAERNVVVHGEGFMEDSVVSISAPGVEVRETIFQSDRVLVATLSVSADAPFGPRDVVVMNPDGDRATCPGCFSIQESDRDGEGEGE